MPFASAVALPDQISAHQSGYVDSLRDKLPRDTILIHTDFKENVKYPLSPEETGEERHAQNKLSLTVSGANVLVPTDGDGQLGPFVLIVTEVLDHDAQAACMTTNTVLAFRCANSPWGSLVTARSLSHRCRLRAPLSQ